ncbi:hypothetical protein BT96DRAFT_986303 [Gymnopus androsaceus JB14]|uniref:Uncharacterized protein n=1 Tax=Gymnopus androsaceus JB14 TaxID=1447944 RepID=A0A6A4IFU8_9AGAR|nr:hypothetical protein BT96DRAFT_986303 [Gymnopus androsaceus JB14]
MLLHVDVHFMVDTLCIFMILSQMDLHCLENSLISQPKLEKEKEAKLEKEKKAKLEKKKETNLDKEKETKSMRHTTWADLGKIQDMVEQALLGLAMQDDKEVQEHAAAFVDFVKLIDQRVSLFQTSLSQRIGSFASTHSSTQSLRSGSITSSFSSPSSATFPMPSTPTPFTRMIGAGTGKVKGKQRQASSSSPIPASQIRQNYLVAHPPPQVFGLLHMQPSQLLCRFLHRDRIAMSG